MCQPYFVTELNTLPCALCPHWAPIIADVRLDRTQRQLHYWWLMTPYPLIWAPLVFVLYRWPWCHVYHDKDWRRSYQSIHMKRRTYLWELYFTDYILQFRYDMLWTKSQMILGFYPPPPPLEKRASILASDIFKCILLNENGGIPIQVSLHLFLEVQWTISQHWFW